MSNDAHRRPCLFWGLKNFRRRFPINYFYFFLSTYYVLSKPKPNMGTENYPELHYWWKSEKFVYYRKGNNSPLGLHMLDVEEICYKKVYYLVFVYYEMVIFVRFSYIVVPNYYPYITIDPWLGVSLLFAKELYWLLRSTIILFYFWTERNDQNFQHKSYGEEVAVVPKIESDIGSCISSWMNVKRSTYANMLRTFYGLIDNLYYRIKKKNKRR